ncbi:MAG: 3-hydroxybutyryl-CoA dehydrogenase [Nocardioidaceae bacterium]
MRVGVVGGGLMGAGIAEVCARRGCDVTVVEANEVLADRAQQNVEKSLGRALKSGKMAEDEHRDVVGRLAYSSSLEDLEGSDVAIEAIIENERLKRELFHELDRILPDAPFLGSNTSSVPIMKLGAETSKPERVIGLHFFNPVPVMPLVELVRSILTSHDALDEARRFAEQTLGKKCINSQDRAGFIVNALLVPYVLSGIRMFESGFASKDDIDRGMKLGCNHPMGPLELADLVGLDTLLAVSESLYEEFRDPSTVAPALLHRMVEAGLLGRKSGHGFYDYREEGASLSQAIGMR